MIFKRKKKKKGKIIKFLRFNIFFIFVSFLTLAGLYTYAKMQPKLEIKSANAFLMYDDNEDLFFQGSGSREWISLNDINQNVIDATLSTEDKHFYEHDGFDYLRIVKAIYTNIKAGKQNKVLQLLLNNMPKIYF